jgi:uncharacterized protein (DUF1778 family)
LASENRIRSIRFDPDVWALIQRTASADGVSASQFVREAAILRAAWLAGVQSQPFTHVLNDEGRLKDALTHLIDAIGPRGEQSDALVRFIDALQDSRFADIKPEARPGRRLPTPG